MNNTFFKNVIYNIFQKCVIYKIFSYLESSYVSREIAKEKVSQIKKFSGAKLTDSGVVTGGDIAVVTGQADYEYIISVCATDSSSAEDGSYSITSTDKKITISGAGNKGTINGVYAFLEKYCGCHWYESEVIVVPKNENLTVPSGINDEYSPYFEYTETDTKSAYDAEFSLANGLTGGIYKDLSPEQGGEVEYLGASSHTLVNQYCKPSDYFDEHPEYFALVNGVRTDTQLCLTNEDVKDIVTAEAFALLEEKHKPDAPIQILSVTQADNELYCQCKDCAKVDRANGSQAGTVLTFANEIASRIKADGRYSNVVIDTFAYQYSRKRESRRDFRSVPQRVWAYREARW